jgi:GPH family glycoside/pentoside/hexuronide:cation symporter
MSETIAATHEKLVFLKEKIGYAVGDTASCLYWQTFSMFLMIFYTDTFGISPAVVGTMFLISRFWDAAIDPVMGIIADRTETKYGKFRPWILRGIIPFTVAGIVLFITPDISETGKIIYAYVTYTVVMMVYTMVNVPYGALLGVISPHSDERTQLASYRFIGAFTGNIIVQGTLLALVSFFGKGNDRLGYPLAMTVFAVAAGALFFFTFASTKERVKPPKEKSTIRTDIKDLLKNRPWIVLCSMGLMTLIYVSIKNGAMLYYFKYYVGDQAAAAPFMVAGTVFSILGALSTPYIVRFIGSKKATFIVLTLINAASMAVFYFAGPKDFVLMYATQIIGSIPGAALFPLIWSMYADTADYGEWKFGRRATGLVFSAATFSQKMGWAVGGALAGFLLTIIGFVANVAQNDATLSGIRHMMSTIPAAIALVVIAISLFYELSDKLEKQVGRELQARKTTAS